MTKLYVLIAYRCVSLIILSVTFNLFLFQKMAFEKCFMLLFVFGMFVLDSIAWDNRLPGESYGELNRNHNTPM